MTDTTTTTTTTATTTTTTTPAPTDAALWDAWRTAVDTTDPTQGNAA